MQTAAQTVILGSPAVLGAEDGPFSLPLSDGTSVVCERVVRRVPGARLVCSGRWQGRAIYAKIFIGPRAERHAARDRRGVRWLQERGIDTPALLYEAQLPDGAGWVLLFEAIEDSCNAEEYLASLAGDAQARLRLMETLVRVVARHHQAGVRQTDLYLKNFLIQGERVYTLDGDGIRAGRGPLGPRRSLRNLALLLSKFDVEEDVHLPQLLQVYAEVRGWQTDARMLRRLEEAVWRHRYQVAQEYAMRKVLRTCTDVRVEQRWDRFLAVARAHDGPELRALLDRPDDWLERPACRRLKTGNTCTIGVVTAGARRIVIKRYNVKGFWHGLKIALRRSRAVRSWCNAHLLRMYGIATARPLAVLERRFGPLRRQAYFFRRMGGRPRCRTNSSPMPRSLTKSGAKWPSAWRSSCTSCTCWASSTATSKPTTSRSSTEVHGCLISMPCANTATPVAAGTAGAMPAICAASCKTGRTRRRSALCWNRPCGASMGRIRCCGGPACRSSRKK